jgi:DNA-binding NarL/FixJ family response regulator
MPRGLFNMAADKRIRAAYEAGASIQEIAANNSMQAPYVRTAIRRAGGKLRMGHKPGTMRPEGRQHRIAVATMLSNGVKVDQIAAELHITRSTVRLIWRKLWNEAR